MAIKTNINKPKLNEQLEPFGRMEAVLTTIEEDEVIQNICLSRDEASGQNYAGKELACCLLEENRYVHCSFHKSSFVDVIFRNCDFSNSSFQDCYFMRCEFLSCKGVGMDMQRAVMKQTLIRDSNLQYANLNDMLLEQVLFEGTDMTEAFMSEVKFKNWRAAGSIFVGTNFFRTKLKGMDFSECELANLIVSEELVELRGMKVNPVQALDLVQLLKIQVV